MVIEAAERCKNWRDEMGNWFVVSCSAIPEMNSDIIVGGNGDILGVRRSDSYGFSVKVQGPWGRDRVDQEILEMVVDRVPDMTKFVGQMTLLELDGICPDGAIRVWGEYEVD